MASHNLIGALAIVTLLLVAGFAIAHFTNFLRDPKNKGAAKNTLVNDGQSATSKVAEGSIGGNQSGHSIKQRLDASSSSMHPDHPLHKKAGESRAA